MSKISDLYTKLVSNINGDLLVYVDRHYINIIKSAPKEWDSSDELTNLITQWLSINVDTHTLAPMVPDLKSVTSHVVDAMLDDLKTRIRSAFPKKFRKLKEFKMLEAVSVTNLIKDNDALQDSFVELWKYAKSEVPPRGISVELQENKHVKNMMGVLTILREKHIDGKAIPY